MDTLVINAHPQYEYKNSYTSIMEEKFIEKFKVEFPDSKLEILNLYKANVPELDEKLLGVYIKEAKGEPLTQEEKEIEEISFKLLNQFKKYKRIVISTPIYNYNIVGKLKAYFDNILKPRHTFKYGKEGPIALMTDGRKVLMLESSGSVYKKDDPYVKLDFTNPYLKAMFIDLMGFESFEILRTEGTNLSSYTKEDILKKFDKDLNDCWNRFYN